VPSFKGRSPHGERVKEALSFGADSPSPRIREDYGGFDLAVRYGPILFEQPVFFVGRYDLKAVSFVETDRPGCVRPGADQDGIVGHLAQVREQKRSDSLLLACGADILVRKVRVWWGTRICDWATCQGNSAAKGRMNKSGMSSK
jgi:hypothetical protein